MAKAIGISEAKIRQAIWMLKAKKTKKEGSVKEDYFIRETGYC